MERTLVSIPIMSEQSGVDRLLADSRPWLFRLALAITSQRDLAEDAAQEALIRARRKLSAAEDPKAYLRAILVRCALDQLARAKTPGTAQGPSLDDPTVAIAVRQTLCRLRPDDRALLALVHFEELSYGEIATTLNIPVGTVASRIHKAREAFRQEWEK
jgi:RNA polymerase sigma-70 factor (ECF subfamily)